MFGSIGRRLSANGKRLFSRSFATEAEPAPERELISRRLAGLADAPSTAAEEEAGTDVAIAPAATSPTPGLERAPNPSASRAPRPPRPRLDGPRPRMPAAVVLAGDLGSVAPFFVRLLHTRLELFDDGIDGRHVETRSFDPVGGRWRLQFDDPRLPQALEALGMEPHASEIFEVGGFRFRVAPTPVRFPYDLGDEGLTPLRRFDPRTALTSHSAHVLVAALITPIERARWSVARRLEEARALHRLAVVVGDLVEASALYWDLSRGFLSLDDAREADAALAAAADLDALASIAVSQWMQYFPSQAFPQEASLRHLRGLVTLGARAFIGREIEIAPVPRADAELAAWAACAARRVLTGALPQTDGAEMTAPEDGPRGAVLRIADDGLLRKDIPALVVAATDGIVDPATLRADPERAPADPRPAAAPTASIGLEAVVLAETASAFDLSAWIAQLGAEAIEPPAEASARFALDGLRFEARVASERFSYDPERETWKTLQSFDPTDALAAHGAHLIVRPLDEAAPEDVDWRVATAEALDKATAAAAAAPGALAVYWSSAMRFEAAARFAERLEPGGDRMALQQQRIGRWLQFAVFHLTNQGGRFAECRGALTFGLAPFLGRELEIAARPGDPRHAVAMAATLAYEMMFDGVELPDGKAVHNEALGERFTVREAERFARAETPALVVVSDQSPTDPETLLIEAAPS